MTIKVKSSGKSNKENIIIAVLKELDRDENSGHLLQSQYRNAGRERQLKESDRAV